ncbi:MAG: hypothetical protein GY698_16450 [Actinomycetia bacterium]|nr:hypothetical protein [Actinomycetes bacterium]
MRRSPLGPVLALAVLAAACSGLSSSPPVASPTTSSSSVPAAVTTTVTPDEGPAIDAGDDPLAALDHLVPESGAWLGSSVDFQDGNDDIALLGAREEQIGREFDLFRDYRQWGQEFPDPAHVELAAQGRIVMYSWKPNRPWAEIAAGGEDAEIRATAARFLEFGGHTMLAFHHEPEDEVGGRFGSAADFAAAFRHIHEVFQEEGAGDVVFVWALIGYERWFPLYDELYPGDDVVDWIAWDPYNWAACRPLVAWETLEEASAPFYELAAATWPDKPLMVGEFGTSEDPGDPDAKATWFRHFAAMAEAERPAVKAWVYFDLGHPAVECHWRLDSSPESLAGFAEAAAIPWLDPLGG